MMITVKEGTAMEAKLVRLNDLKEFPRNPKEHDLGSIHTSIQQWGYLERIVINSETGHIISGHGRTEILRQMKSSGDATPDGITIDGDDWLVPVDYVAIPQDQEGAAAIALNRTVELGGWNDLKLAELLQELASDDDATLLAASGYDGDDIDNLLDDINEPHPKATDDNKTCPCCGQPLD